MIPVHGHGFVEVCCFDLQLQSVRLSATLACRDRRGVISNKAKTIQIFLPDGNPRGVRIAEITSRTVQICLLPRASLDLTLKRDELAAPGHYLLFSSSEDNGNQRLILGKSK